MKVGVVESDGKGHAQSDPNQPKNRGLGGPMFFLLIFGEVLKKLAFSMTFGWVPNRPNISKFRFVGRRAQKSAQGRRERRLP